MRIRAVVHRYGFSKPLKVWWPLGDKLSENPHMMVSDLLRSINEVYPLDDDNYGLEEYAVSMDDAELLHFTTVKTILRDGDEISIRPLTQTEIRVQERSGRRQVSTSARRLLDGVPFGRPFLQVARDRRVISTRPTKRARINHDQPGEQAGPLENPLLQTNALTTTFDEMDEDSESEDSEYDPDMTDDDSLDSDKLKEDDDDNEDFTDEAMSLLTVLEKPPSRPEASPTVPSSMRRSRKRKVEFHDPPTTHINGENQGIDNAQTPIHNSSQLHSINATQIVSYIDPEASINTKIDNATSAIGTMSASISDSEPITSGSSSSSASSSSMSSSCSETDSSSDSNSDSSSLSSSSSSSDSESENSSEEEDDEKEEEEEVEALAPTKILESKPNKTPTTDFIDPPVNGVPFKGTRATKTRNLRRREGKKLRELIENGLLPKNATKNELYDWEALKLLEPAKAVAIQSNDATLKLSIHAEVVPPKPLTSGEQNISTRLADEEAETAMDLTPHIKIISNSRPSSPYYTPFAEADETSLPPASEAVPALPSNEKTPERKRLALNSQAANRMIFGSLGMRTPKSKEEAEAARNKLRFRSQDPKSKSEFIRKAAERADRTEANEQSTPLNEEEGSIEVVEETPDTTEAAKSTSWRDKIRLSAVECEDLDYTTLPIPDYPFVQDNLRKGKGKRSLESQQYQRVENDEEEAGVDNNVEVEVEVEGSSYMSIGDISDTNGPSQQLYMEYQVEAASPDEGEIEDEEEEEEEEEDNMPELPVDLSTYVKLTSSFTLDSVIAFQQLYMDGFNPVFGYRVGRVVELSRDGKTAQIQLAKRYNRKIPKEPGTKNKQYSGLDMPGMEESEDVELVLGQMRDPIYLLSSSHVPQNSNVNSSIVGDETFNDNVDESQHESSVVKDSQIFLQTDSSKLNITGDGQPDAISSSCEAGRFLDAELPSQLDFATNKSNSSFIVDSPKNGSCGYGREDSLQADGPSPTKISQPITEIQQDDTKDIIREESHEIINIESLSDDDDELLSVSDMIQGKAPIKNESEEEEDEDEDGYNDRIMEISSPPQPTVKPTKIEPISQALSSGNLEDDDPVTFKRKPRKTNTFVDLELESSDLENPFPSTMPEKSLTSGKTAKSGRPPKKRTYESSRSDSAIDLTLSSEPDPMPLKKEKAKIISSDSEYEPPSSQFKDVSKRSSGNGTEKTGFRSQIFKPKLKQDKRRSSQSVEPAKQWRVESNTQR